MNNEDITLLWKSGIEVSDPELMRATPLVSVLMITYNHGPYLAEAIEGVCKQITDFPIELIIGEDCSTDGSRAIALDYQQRYSGVIRVVFSENNVGMHNNFLRVLNLCRGEFIAFCEGDDYWICKNKLQVQVDYLRNRPDIGLCFHPVYTKSMINLDAHEVMCFHGETSFEIPVSEVIRNGGGFCPSCSLVFRSEKIKRNLWLLQDLPITDYFVQVLAALPNGAGYIGLFMGVYRQDVPGSYSSGMKLWKKRLKLSEDLLNILDKFNVYLKRDFSSEINEYKKKIQLSIMIDNEIPIIEKIRMHRNFKIKLDFFVVVKIFMKELFTTLYRFVVVNKVHLKDSSVVR